MLYVFKSRASASLIMLEPQGRRLLQILGKEVAPKGIILPADMPAAVAALQEAIRADEENEGAQQASGCEHSTASADPVRLRHRMQPMIAMLQLCAKADREIVWGV